MSNGFENYFRPLGEPEPDGYDVAQVCMNGHIVNNCYRSDPDHNSDHCPGCGEKTVIACPKCKAPIRGHYHSSLGVIFGAAATRGPNFCYKCGAGYPWTESRLSSAREYIREMERLTENEKGILDRSLDDLIRDTPRTQVAALRFKQYAAKAGQSAMEGLKTILVQVMAETAKKAIWG